MIIKWDLSAIAGAFGVSPQEYWGDQNGATLSKTAERTVASHVQGDLTESQEAYDVISGIDRWATLIEVRNCVKKACFAPSTSTGKGRKFELNLFEKKIDECDSYVFLDLNPLDKLAQPRAFEIPAKLVGELFKLGALGKNAHIDFAPRKQFPKNWENRTFRFSELFPYSEFAFQPDRTEDLKYNAREVVRNAIDRINKHRGA
jgi:hypothetical protein